jgi:putative ABC transport system substrate-binding protein
MQRREFITLLGGAAATWPLAARAQTEPAVLRVGTASPTPRKAETSFLKPFEQRMAELGYVQGKNFELDYIYVDAPGHFGEPFQELVRRKVDIILAYGAEAALKAALAATHTIPIVMVAIDYDPLRLGYVTNLARPTGNVTGLFFEQIELAAKRIQLLKEAFPAIHAATVFWDEISADQWKATRDSAAQLSLQVAGIELHNYPYDYARALAQAPAEHRGFLIVMTSPYFARDRERLVQFTTDKRVASMFVFREYVELGGLMSYGPSREVMSRRAADYVNRIARGAKPSDLPIERPTLFELAINLKAAKLLGLEFSQAMLLRADKVIE